MKKLLLSLNICFAFYAQSQINTGNTDMPSVGDTVRYSTASTNTTSLINKKGANQTWDASNLLPTFQDVPSFRSPGSISLLYNLSFAGSTYGTDLQNFNLGALIQATDAYSFFRNAQSVYVNTGRAFSVQGIPLTQTWRDTVYRFPLAYNTKDSCVWITSEVNALIATIKSTGKRVNEVDAWGTITTPYGTFDCIRVKSILRITDTIRTSFIPIAFPLTQNITEYKWITNNEKIPVFEIIVQTGMGGQTTIKYRDIYRAQAFNNKARFMANKRNFIANNIDTCILNDISTNNPQSWLWTITPNTFRFVNGTDNTTQRPEILFDEAGSYSISLRAGYRGGFDDTTYTDYITVGINGLNQVQHNISVRIFPNPATNLLHIESDKTISHYSLIDLQGRMITHAESINENSSVIDVSNLQKGMYMLLLTDDLGNQAIRRFVVQQ
jgi:hypothetical protein